MLHGSTHSQLFLQAPKLLSFRQGLHMYVVCGCQQSHKNRVFLVVLATCCCSWGFRAPVVETILLSQYVTWLVKRFCLWLLLLVAGAGC